MNKIKVWNEYLQYLRDWADSHNKPEFCGATPACFDEWYGCEYQEKVEDIGDGDTEPSGSYRVTITETLQKVVTLNADSPNDAEQTAFDNWRAGDYILEADSFVGVEFTALPAAA